MVPDIRAGSEIGTERDRGVEPLLNLSVKIDEVSDSSKSSKAQKYNLKL